MAVTASCEACKACCSEDRWCVSRGYGLTDRLCRDEGIVRQIKRVGTQGDKFTVLALVLVIVGSVMFLGIVAWYCLCKRKTDSTAPPPKQPEAADIRASLGHEKQHHSANQKDHSEERP